MSQRHATQPQSLNITWHCGSVTRGDRERARLHRSAVLWFTGLSGAGKSTLASELERRLFARGCVSYVLDGDNVRHGLSKDLGLSPADRAEHNRRVGEVAKLFVDAGVLCLCAFISPYREDRARLRARIGSPDFLEIYVRSPLALCEARDPKGLYKKARAGEILDMTGIGTPYEVPENPEVVLDTEACSVEDNATRLLSFLETRGYVMPAH